MMQDNEPEIPVTEEQVRADVKLAMEGELERIRAVAESGERGAVAARLALELFAGFETAIRVEIAVHDTEAIEVAKAAAMVFGDMFYSAGMTLSDEPLQACQIMVAEMNTRLTAHFSRPNANKPQSKIILPGGGMNKKDAALYSKVIRGNGRL